MIRDVRISDAAGITEIYNYYVENTTVTFDEVPVSAVETERKIRRISDRNYPYIVCEEDGEIAGYAYLSEWRSHSAYRITLETSVYLAPRFIGKGLGSLLYRELIAKARKMNIRSLIGVLAVPNEASRNLHKKLGFELVGIFKETGCKFNRLIDVEFWQLKITNFSPE